MTFKLPDVVADWLPYARNHLTVIADLVERSKNPDAVLTPVERDVLRAAAKVLDKLNV